MTATPLDLDQLIRAYWDNLNVTLRGFQAAEGLDFLESWVPSDDPSDSLMDLVELARDAGQPALAVVLDEATAAKVDAARVEDRTGPFRREVQGGRVLVTFALSPELELAIHPCYRTALRQALTRVTHEGAIPDGPETYRAARDGVTLAATVAPRNRAVTRAAFQGTASPVQRGLLEVLCAEMEGKPLQECADHALIAVESRLRDPHQPPPVPGLVTPDNADPAFALPQHLIRALMAEYRDRTGWQNTANFYDAPVSPSWAKLGDDERAAAIRRELEARGLAGEVELVRLEGPKRVVVRFLTNSPSPVRQEQLRQLEEHLRQHVEATLHLTTQARADSNLLRQPELKKSP